MRPPARTTGWAGPAAASRSGRITVTPTIASDLASGCAGAASAQSATNIKPNATLNIRIFRSPRAGRPRVDAFAVESCNIRRKLRFVKELRMNYWPLSGVAVVVAGFALRLNPALVVGPAGIGCGGVSGVSMPDLLALLGHSFLSNRMLML